MIDCLFVASSKLELEGILTNYPKVVIGVGKAQSAVRTMKAIEIYKPKRIICLGYAGAITQNLRIGDLVCASSVLQYDIDLTSFGLKRCEVPTGDSNNLLGSLPLYVFPQTEARIGICGTADRFLLRSYRKDNPFLWEELGLLFCDMESYSVALAAKYNDVPCSVVRVISDDSEGHRPKHFPRFVSEANKVLTAFLEKNLQ